MYKIFLIQIAFQRSEIIELDYLGFVIEIALNFKSQGTEKSNFPSKGPTNFKFWEIKLLQVKGPQNVDPKRKAAIFLLKWFGIILFVYK